MRAEPRAAALRTLNDADFSLDWPTRADHDAARGAPLFDLVVGSIRRCRELGLPCSITVCATRENFTEPTIAGFLDLASLLGCELRVNTLKPVELRLLARMPTRDQFYAGFAQLMAATECLTLAEGCLTAFTASGAVGCTCGLRYCTLARRMLEFLVWDVHDRVGLELPTPADLVPAYAPMGGLLAGRPVGLDRGIGHETDA